MSSSPVLSCLPVICLCLAICRGSASPVILFNNEDNGINYEFLDSEDTERVIIAENSTKLYETNYKIKSLDFDIEDKYFVWSSSEYPYPIYVANYRTKQLNDSRTKFQVTKTSIIAKRNSQTKIAVDWVHDLVFYFNYRTLRVVHTQQTETSYDLTGKTNPDEKWKYSSSNIVVNPYEAFVVWAEYNSIDGLAIMRKCSEDGSNQQILVYKDIRLPVCIAIDYETKSILWIDNELHSLSSIDYNGANRKTLRLSKSLFSDCSSMDIYNGSVYWSSPKSNSIQRLHLRNTNIDKSNATTIVESDADIDFVRIMSPTKQNKSENYCHSAECPHICLPTGPQDFRCLCADIPQLEDCNGNTTKELTFASPSIPEITQNTTVVSQLVKSQEPLLVFSARKRDIRLAKVPSDQSIHYSETEFLYNLDNYVTALDYSLSGNYLVWLKSNSSIYSYVSKTNLYAVPIDPTANNSLNVNGITRLATLSQDLNLKSLAIDWIHNLLYYPICESMTKGVYVLNMSSPTHPYRVVKLSHCVKDIRVDPNEALLFWNEYNENYGNSYSTYPYSSYRTYSRYRSTQNSKSVIKKSSESGNPGHIFTLTETSQTVVQKNSLSLDLKERRVYWIERSSYYSSSLHSIDYEGNTKTVHIQSTAIFDDFSAMDIFGDSIYWVNNEDDTIRRIIKNDTINPSDWTTALQSGVDIEAMKIISKDVQINGANRCLNHICQTLCLPHNNTYSCHCATTGYTWSGSACVSDSGRVATTTTTASPIEPNPEQFDALDNEPKLLFVVYKEGIYVKQNLNDTLRTNYLESMELKQNSDWITEVDYNFNENYMIWLESSVFDGFSLNAAPIDKTRPNGPRFVNQKKIISKPYNAKRIAFDWIHKLVYLSVPKGIEVYTIEGNVYINQIVSHDEVQGDLAVDPINGVLVWSKWRYVAINNQHSGSIMRSYQDGSDQRELASATKIPNTLALDIGTKTIYWIDTSQYTLYSMDYNGFNLEPIIYSRNLFDGSFSMDVFDNYIFWSNYDKNAILKTDKSGANHTEVIVVVNAYTDLEGIRVLDSTRQKNGTNRCANHTCSHMCLPRHNEHRCVCSKIKVVGSPCVETETSPPTRSQTTTSQPIPSAPEIIASHAVVNNQDNERLRNLSQKLDDVHKLLNGSVKTESSDTTHRWIVIIVISVSLNMLLIAFLVYRKRKMKYLSKYIMAKFRNEADEVILDEHSTDDL